MEKVYDAEMNNKYKIIELNEMYKGIPTSYQFSNSKINVYHKLKDNQTYKDPWDYVINLADVYISINDETKEVLKNYPVKVGQEGLNQYTHYVSYWIVENKKTNKQSFVIVLQKNGARQKELPNGEGFVPQEKLKYLSLTIQEDGAVTKDSFTYKNKNKLQTKLIPPMNFGGAGYYTDAWFSYPIFFFPFIYPFLTTILGLILILVSIKYKVLFNKTT
ncbi:hypothetical protein AB1K32_25270 [Metabacillus dongyingensis]|uniref:hypothetical protein n=1 Tax=Metabacillus dongyingensis TaxID=2874282 RepID=UPI003B8DDA90